MDFKKKILIVDDKSMNRFMLAGIFGDEFEIVEAANGREAIEKIASEKESLGCILLDIIMPEIDGFGVLDYLKGHAMIDSIPVVIVTNDASEDTGCRAYEYGVADMVIKPFEPRIIRRRVENIMELYAYRERERHGRKNDR